MQVVKTDRDSIARDFLKQHGMQVTLPRLAVIEDLMRYRVHATAEEIYQRINALERDASMPMDERLSRASVYNILNALVERQAIRALTIDDKQTRYDIDCTPHAHFRCTRCGRIVDLPMPKLRCGCLPAGYEVVHSDLYHIGTCPDCRRAMYSLSAKGGGIRIQR